MADGDRFERRLCGKGWPKAYRLAAGGASIELVGDVIMTAVAAGLRGPLNCPALPGMRDAVYDVLRQSIRVGQLDLMGRVSPDAYGSLVDTLTQLAGNQPTVSAQLAMQASLSVYLELHVADTSLSVNRVQARLSEAFVERLVRHQWLDRVHDGIMEGTGCSITDQITWDARLFNNLAPRSRQMLQAFFRSSGLSVVRAPRRTVPRREMTIGDLHQGLPVLGS